MSFGEYLPIHSHHRVSRQTTFHSRVDLLEEIIHPGALESRSQIAEELSEMRDQLRKQVQRIRELRVRKVEEPGEYCRRQVSMTPDSW